MLSPGIDVQCVGRQDHDDGGEASDQASNAEWFLMTCPVKLRPLLTGLQSWSCAGCALPLSHWSVVGVDMVASHSSVDS